MSHDASGHDLAITVLQPLAVRLTEEEGRKREVRDALAELPELPRPPHMNRPPDLGSFLASLWSFVWALWWAATAVCLVALVLVGTESADTICLVLLILMGLAALVRVLLWGKEWSEHREYEEIVACADSRDRERGRLEAQLAEESP